MDVQSILVHVYYISMYATYYILMYVYTFCVVHVHKLHIDVCTFYIGVCTLHINVCTFYIGACTLHIDVCTFYIDACIPINLIPASLSFFPTIFGLFLYRILNLNTLKTMYVCITVYKTYF